MHTPVHASALVKILCLLGALGGILGCSPPVRLVGNMSSSELSEITETVHRQFEKQWGSTSGRPIKSIEVTTNNSYRHDLRLLSAFEAIAKTNSSLEARLAKVRERVQSGIGATNRAVYVWYSDPGARWGEAGWVVEKEGTEWKIAYEVFH